MGVKGLWHLLECVGRPVTLESLENKVLGVDASLILNQSVKGMRDKNGNPIHNAHLVGLFNRVCKLLYYRIKPVFVFDGGVPHLKKKTLEARRERRFKAIHGSNKAAEKILKNYLKSKALETVTGRKSTTAPRSKSPREPDVFELAPLPSTASAETRSFTEEDEISILDQFRSQQLEQTYQDPAAINIDSQDFKSLPSEIQHELIKEIKEERKWRHKNDMPRQSSDFSSFQLEGVLKRGKMNQRLDELCKEMNSRNSGDLAGAVPQDSLGENTDVKSQKILSEDSAHYILIKSTENVQTKDQDQLEGEGGFFHEGQDCHIISWTNPLTKPRVPTKPPSFEIPEHFSSDSEILSPLMDVQETDISQHTPRTETKAFSFSPVKGNESSDKVVLNVDDKFKDEGDAVKPHAQNADNIGSLNGEKKGEVQQEQILLGRSSTQEGNKNEILLTQIMNKKKELEDLIKMWEVSNKPVTATDLTLTLDGDVSRESEHMSCLSSEVKQQENNIEVSESSETVTVIGDDQLKMEKNGRSTVCVIDSDSEGSSVEEMTASFKPVKSVIKDAARKSGIVQNVIGSREAESILIDGDEDSVKATTEIKLVSRDVDMDTVLSDDAPADEIEQNTDHSCSSNVVENVEVQDSSSEESGIGMAVDEQEAGPSGVPVEWQEATVESLEEIQKNIESEQKTLATERARQNRMAATVSNEMFSECQELLQLFGVPYLVCPMEAEAQCAALDVLGLTEGSITDDSDIFLFGGTRVYKNIFNQNKHVELYCSDAVQRNLALNRLNLICIAFITGSDYTEGIQGVGPVGAMEILQEFAGEGLEGLKKFKTWHKEAQEQTKIPQETKVKRKMRTIVLPIDFPSEEVYEAYLRPVVDESMEQFQWGKPDLHSLRLFASDRLGWSSARTDEILLPVLKQLNKDETQMKISDFFRVAFQEKRNIKSKRIRQVVNRVLNPTVEEESKDENKSGRKEKADQDKVPSKAATQHGNHEIGSLKSQPKKKINVKNPKRAKEENKVDLTAARKKGKELLVQITPLQMSFPGNRKSPQKGSSEKAANQSLFPEEQTRTREKRGASSQNSGCGWKDDSTSDSMGSDDDDRNVCTGPDPVHGVYLERKNGEHAPGTSSDSSEDNVENVYEGPKPVSIFHQGRRKGKGKKRGRGRGEERKSCAKEQRLTSECEGDDDNATNVPETIKAALSINRGKTRGRGKKRRR
ncbi:DNA excision repair protein ERCC-5-like [Montipora foliosa]|uniref:DNA excision repair protein ERCC-5-like n=1 Tax=Montipora foliosa TaxID=591990 RepID=UPI0035F20D98